MMKQLIVELERILFNLTGVELPLLHKSWVEHCDKIQLLLDLQHKTYISSKWNKL